MPSRIGDIERLRSPPIEAGGETFGRLAVDLGDSFVQQNHRRAEGQRRADRVFGAEASAQQLREPIGLRSCQDRIGELDDLPIAVGRAEREAVRAAAQDRVGRGARQFPGIELHLEDGAFVPILRRPGGKRLDGFANGGPNGKRGIEHEIRPCGTVHHHDAAPGRGGRRGIGRKAVVGVAQQRQIHQPQDRRAIDRRRRERRRRNAVQRRRIDRRFRAHGFGFARALVEHARQPERPRLAIDDEIDHVARIERDARRRQRQLRGLAGNPCFDERAIGDRLRLNLIHHERQPQIALALGITGKPRRRDRAGLVFVNGVGEADRHFVRKFGFLAARQRDLFALIGHGEFGQGQRGDRGPPARHEADHAVGFDRIEGIGGRQRFDLGARAHRPVAQISGDDADQRRHIIGREADAAAAFGDERGQIGEADLAVQPVAERIEIAVGPEIGASRPGGIGTRVPCPDAEGLDHPAAIDARSRVIGA